MSKQKSQEQTVVANTAKPVTESPKATVKPTKDALPLLFDKQNYIIMAVGLVVIILGYILMVGGRSADPNVFDADALYSFRRITLAPVLVLVGLAIEGYAIMKRPSNTN